MHARRHYNVYENEAPQVSRPVSHPVPAIAARFAPRVKFAEPMSRHTSWHIGGPADVFFTPADRTDLLAFLETLPKGTPLFWLGLGSNLLVRDGGIRGVVVSVHGILTALERVGETSVRAEAGVACARLGRQCAKWQLGPAGVAEQATLKRHEALEADDPDQVAEPVTSQDLGDLTVPAPVSVLASTDQVACSESRSSLEPTVPS